MCAVVACGGYDEPPTVRSDLARNVTPEVSPADQAALVAGNTEFAADLYREVCGTPGNLFMSPHSISIALAMTYAGAAGTTAVQMAEALGFALPAEQLHPAFDHLDLELASRGATAGSHTIPFRLEIANSIWGQHGKQFRDPFLDTLAVNYGTGLHVLDFEADPDGSRETINGWVEQRTNDKIVELLPDGSITSDTQLVLTNAIYFTAAWAEPFDAGQTATRPFQIAGSPVPVATLHQDFEASYGEGDGFRAAELAYDGGKLAMVIVVPDDLAAFEATLTGATFAAITGSLRGHMLDLTLPKFSFDAGLDLKKPLEALGMVDAFSSATADFSGIDGARGLVIDDVLHKGFVAIDENGTEAAAATAVLVGNTAVPERATLQVDRPFVFFIRDIPTGAILFVGRVVDPR